MRGDHVTRSQTQFSVLSHVSNCRIPKVGPRAIQRSPQTQPPNVQINEIWIWASRADRFRRSYAEATEHLRYMWLTHQSSACVTVDPILFLDAHVNISLSRVTLT